MKKRCLHVALIVVSMAVICCVSAFAEMSYPEGYPALPDPLPAPYCIIADKPDSDGKVLMLFEDSSFVRANVGGDVFINANCPFQLYKKYGDSWLILEDWHSYSYATYACLSSQFLYCNFNIYDSDGNLIYDGAPPPPPPPPPPDPYESFWSDLQEVGTGVLGWAGNVASTITHEPVLLFTVGIFILGAAIGIFRRLLVRG